MLNSQNTTSDLMQHWLIPVYWYRVNMLGIGSSCLLAPLFDVFPIEVSDSHGKYSSADLIQHVKYDRVDKGNTLIDWLVYATLVFSNTNMRSLDITCVYSRYVKRMRIYWHCGRSMPAASSRWIRNSLISTKCVQLTVSSYSNSCKNSTKATTICENRY